MWMFAIDTEQFAGNFDREMTAYMTGISDHSGVGGNEADHFFNDIGLDPNDNSPFASLFGSVRNEDGSITTCKRLPTPGWFNNGWGGHFPDDGSHEAEAKLSRRMQDAPLNKFPAYLSVGISFLRQPREDELRFFMNRAWYYVRYRNRIGEPPITITGFRLLEEATHSEVRKWTQQGKEIYR